MKNCSKPRGWLHFQFPTSCPIDRSPRMRKIRKNLIVSCPTKKLEKAISLSKILRFKQFGPTASSIGK